MFTTAFDDKSKLIIRYLLLESFSSLAMLGDKVSGDASATKCADENERESGERSLSFSGCRLLHTDAGWLCCGRCSKLC